MRLSCESSLLEDYLCEHEVIDYSHPLIQETIRHLHLSGASETERIKTTYEFVRDHIPHSWDIQAAQVTRKASEVLHYSTGICYAKAHLLAALLRGQDVPTGFCYQRLMSGSHPDEGYAIHAFNAVYARSAARWIRLDARGNKPGVQAEFSLKDPKLAYTVRPELGEIDYPIIYAQPHPATVRVLQEQSDCLQMCRYFLPDSL